MIHTHRTLRADVMVDADVCIVGSGAGGSAAAYALSAAGKRVVVLERGSFYTPKDFTQREEQMFPKLFYGSGGRRTKNRAIRVLHGHGVGGSTLHNINLCKRPPDEVVASWGLTNFTPASFKPFVEKIEELLGVSALAQSQLNANNRVLKKGLEKLGYAGGFLHHNRQGCVGSGFCELGCSFDAKLNAMRVLLPEAIRKGTEVYADTRAVRFERNGLNVKSLIADVLVPGSEQVQARLRVNAKIFVCAGGAVETPALLLRSDLPDPHHQIGARLHLHPGAVVAGVFDEKIESWRGIPQSYECTEFLSFDPQKNRRIWMITGSAHPAGAASLLPGFGAEHRAQMKLFPYFAPLSAMVHDQTRGTVTRKGDYDVDLNYVLNDADRAQMAIGLREAARILFAAGAREVIVPFTDPLRLRAASELEQAKLEVRDHEIDLVSVHPMSSMPMGRDDKDSCLDDQGRYRHLDNLFVADASIYPSSLGVPPQISTYAVGLYVAQKVDASF